MAWASPQSLISGRPVRGKARVRVPGFVTPSSVDDAIRRHPTTARTSPTLTTKGESLFNRSIVSEDRCTLPGRKCPATSDIPNPFGEKPFQPTLSNADGSLAAMLAEASSDGVHLPLKSVAYPVYLRHTRPIYHDIGGELIPTEYGTEEYEKFRGEQVIQQRQTLSKQASEWRRHRNQGEAIGNSSGNSNSLDDTEDYSPVVRDDVDGRATVARADAAVREETRQLVREALQQRREAARALRQERKQEREDALLRNKDSYHVSGGKGDNCGSKEEIYIVDPSETTRPYERPRRCNEGFIFPDR